MTTITDPRLRDPATAARGRWLMLIVLLAGQFMALLDVTIVNVAMPTIGRTLHASGAELQLVVAGYTVSYAGSRPLPRYRRGLWLNRSCRRSVKVKGDSKFPLARCRALSPHPARARCPPPGAAGGGCPR